MSTSTSIPTSENAEIEAIESDLRRRLEMLTDDGDLVVLAGLVVAGRGDPAILDEFTSDAAWVPAIGDLASHGIDAEGFSYFQQHWYHFRVPYARASLAWWYVFCLALGRGDTVADALRRMSGWLEATTTGWRSVLPDAGRRLGLPDGTVVVTDAETADLPALLTAARRGVPLLAVDDVSEARRLGRDSGVDILAPGDDATRALGRGELWRGAAVDLRGVTATARKRWNQLPDSERDDLFSMLEARVSSIERVRLLLDGTVVDNRQMAALLATCRCTPVADWTHENLALATVAWCWHTAGFVLQELNQSLVSLPALVVFLVRRAREYRAVLSGPRPDTGHERPTHDVVALAEELGRLRAQVEEGFERCLHFDGSNWERREFLLPLPLYRAGDDLPDSLRERLWSVTGADFRGEPGDPAAWDRLVEGALHAGSSPTRILQEIADWAANTTDLWVDLAIFTVPLGRKLDEPWTMDFTDLFCYTGFRDGFLPEEHGVPLDRVGVHNVVGQRMRYNAVKKAQNYAPVRRFPPQGFNLPDIAVAEDANHAGHSAAGIRLACRVPITIAHGGRDWNGLSDVRLNRAEYHRANRFLPRDLVVAYRYAQWTKGVADATYRRGLGFDEKWAHKVTDLEI